jgi:ABC-type glycerol-3-phosphate transport system substrate-binding protein
MKILNTTKLTTLLKFLSLALACGLASFGCSSMNKPASASFASVTISGRSAAEIRDATIAVFRENGYQVFASSQGLTFEKEGSKINSISRDGLVGSHYGAVTIIRVRVQLVDFGNDTQRLQCQTSMVSGAGDAFTEEEHRLTNFRSGPYQDLLDEVAKRLKQP